MKRTAVTTSTPRRAKPGEIEKAERSEAMGYSSHASSIAWSNGSTIDPLLDGMMKTVEDVAIRALRAGKSCGIYVVDPASAGRFVAMGYRLLAMGSELALLKLGSEALLKAVRASLD